MGSNLGLKFGRERALIGFSIVIKGCEALRGRIHGKNHSNNVLYRHMVEFHLLSSCMTNRVHVMLILPECLT